MASAKELKAISQARLKTAKILIEAEDWDGSAYIMGFALEIALKAVICKTLHLVNYPENTKNRTTDAFFMTHNFDQLLKASGMEDLFSARGKGDEFRNWGDFTQEYQGDWTAMRYNPERLERFKKEEVERLYNNLVGKPSGIITVIKTKRRW